MTYKKEGLAGGELEEGGKFIDVGSDGGVVKRP